MPRFFTTQIQGVTAVISGSDAAHIIGPLRMRPGDPLTVCDLSGWDYLCVITSATSEQVVLRVYERTPCRSEPDVFVRLYQALPKGDKLESITQKATELGVSEIIPVLTSRCVSRPDAKSMEKKRVRLEKIALEAAKQSGRGKVPKIGELLTFKEAVEHMKSAELSLLCYENADAPLSGLLTGKPKTISVLIGSEGGFSPEEAQFAASGDIHTVSLGKRILRCETAPVAVLSAVFFAMGEF